MASHTVYVPPSTAVETVFSGLIKGKSGLATQDIELGGQSVRRQAATAVKVAPKIKNWLCIFSRSPVSLFKDI